MKKSTMKKIIYNGIFVLLLAVALVMIFNRAIKNTVIDSYKPKITRQAIVKAQRHMKNATNHHRRQPVSYNFKKVKSLDFQTAVAARMNTRTIQPAGQILIPQSGIHLPIGLGVANQTLALAAGTMRPDQRMGHGNYPLAGHHMVNPKILFGPLYYKTKVGQQIYLTDMKQVYQYRGYRRTFIAATRVDVINQTKRPIVTLVTCDATGKGRLMIRGRLVAQYRLNAATPKIKRAFLRPANNLS